MGVRRVKLGGFSPFGRIVVLMVLTACNFAVEAVTLAWNPNPESDIAGYRLYYGKTNETATMIDTGTNITRSISNLQPGLSYYFYVTAYNTADLESEPSSSVYYTQPAPPLSGGAKFLGFDSTTGGNWKGSLGRDGHVLIGDTTALPPYGSLAPSGHSQWIWQSPTDNPVALERFGSEARLAACWYSPTVFDIAFNMTGNSPRRVSIYALDWDGLNRTEQIEVLDPVNGMTLDTHTISNFVDGVYLSWEVTKNVIIRVTPVNGPNAVISGIFFDSGSAVEAPEFSPPR